MEIVTDGTTAQLIAAQSELAALREELATARSEHVDRIKFRNMRCEELEQRLADAERRNESLRILMRRMQGVCLFSMPEGMHDEIDAALTKPEEAKSPGDSS
jgi:DNA repair exonuclease SbcCD ATPase subunit